MTAPWRRAWLLAAAIAAAGSTLRLALAPSLGYLGVDGDLFEHKQALQRALTRGVYSVYMDNSSADPALTGRAWSGGYFFNNLPLILYVRYLPGLAYRQAAPDGLELWKAELNYFALESSDLRARLAETRGLTVLLKLPGILADAAIVLVVFGLGRAWRSDTLGLAAAMAYAFNPGVVLDTAFWGQHDSVWILPVLLALSWLANGRVELAWGAYALACLTKPQAWAFAPLVLVATAVGYSWRRGLTAAATAATIGVAVLSPFILHGTWRPSLAALLRSTLGGEPFVSCNALNLWWLLTNGRAYEVSDAAPIAGPLAPRAVGIALVMVLNVVILTASLWSRRRDGRPGALVLCQAAALVYLGFFVFATELHENHLVAALALLAAVARSATPEWLVLGALSVVVAVNITIFDPALCGCIPQSRLVHALTVGTSWLCVTAFAGLAVRTVCLARSA